MILVAALLTWWLTSGRYETIPPLNGVVQNTARNELSNLGLHRALGKSQAQPAAQGRGHLDQAGQRHQGA